MTLKQRSHQTRSSYHQIAKQLHKYYLSWKPQNPVIAKILINAIVIVLLLLLIIFINSHINANSLSANLETVTFQASDNQTHPIHHDSISNPKNQTGSIHNDVDIAADIEPWRVVENHPEFPINANRNLSDPIYIPLRKPWGSIYSPTRVLCMIPILWPDRKWKMDLIKETWGKGCTKLMWVVDDASTPPKSYAGFDFLSLPLTRHQNHTKHVRNIWEKVHRMWTHVYSTPALLDNFEWFIKADDDTFVATENLLGFLQYYDPSYPHYLGHALRHRWKKENVIFNSGTCYVLSRETLRRIGKYLKHLPTVHPAPSKEHCVDREGAGEDPATASCLVGIGVRPGNTLDHELKERFLIFRDTDHAIMWREDTWYWQYRAGGVGEGDHCCSPYLVSMHNYKHKDALRLYPKLQEKYNQPKNWSEIMLPPRPRLVMWDRNSLDFEIDEYLNTEEPPQGQRIYKGEGKEWMCYDCKVGDYRDRWWTEWWDEVPPGAEKSRHVNDAYSPYRDS